MTSRLSLLAALLVAALLLPAAASATARAALVSPGRDAVVSSPVELRVRVTRDVLDPAVRQVHVRLSRDGSSAAPGSAPVALTCVSGCDGTDATWAGRSYDPVTAAPFGGGPACNGRWYLQVSLDGGGFGAATPVLASAPASPARDVRVAIDGRDAVVTWGAAPEPDVAGYRIERRGGDSWTTVGEAPAGATSFVDADVERGSYEWRVVTLRPDGRGDGGALSPCADTQPDLATTSTVTRGRVTEAPPSPSPTEIETEDDATDGSSDRDDDGTADGGAGDDDEPVAGGTVAGGDTAEPDREPVRPPAGAGAAAAAPDADEVPASQRERYYGEDQGVGTLDYGDAAPVERPTTAAAPTGRTWVPGGVSIERDLDRVRLLRPVAGGLVLLTFAFHIRRWQREHDV